MAIIITYDVPEKHTELKQAMYKKGYADKIRHRNDNGNIGNINLPNTTLYHATNDSSTARNDLQSVCQSLGVKLERCVATQWGPNWSAIWGDPLAN